MSEERGLDEIKEEARNKQKKGEQRHTSIPNPPILQISPAHHNMPNRTLPDLKPTQALPDQTFLARKFVDILADLQSMVAQAHRVVLRRAEPVAIAAEDPASLATDFADFSVNGPELSIGVVFDEGLVEGGCGFVCGAVDEDHWVGTRRVFVCVRPEMERRKGGLAIKLSMYRLRKWYNMSRPNGAKSQMQFVMNDWGRPATTK